MRSFFCIIKQILSNSVLKWNTTKLNTITNVWFNRKFSLAARYFHLFYNYFNNHCIRLTSNYSLLITKTFQRISIVRLQDVYSVKISIFKNSSTENRRCSQKIQIFDSSIETSSPSKINLKSRFLMKKKNFNSAR